MWLPPANTHTDTLMRACSTCCCCTILHRYMNYPPNKQETMKMNNTSQVYIMKWRLFEVSQLNMISPVRKCPFNMFSYQLSRSDYISYCCIHTIIWSLLLTCLVIYFCIESKTAKHDPWFLNIVCVYCLSWSYIWIWTFFFYNNLWSTQCMCMVAHLGINKADHTIMQSKIMFTYFRCRKSEELWKYAANSFWKHAANSYIKHWPIIWKLSRNLIGC